MSYAVVIERTDTGYGAFVPALPGCVAVGESEAEVRQLIFEAVEQHLQGMFEDTLAEQGSLQGHGVRIATASGIAAVGSSGSAATFGFALSESQPSATVITTASELLDAQTGAPLSHAC
jgi:predicted RNase H-like HicB family nuclease